MIPSERPGAAASDHQSKVAQPKKTQNSPVDTGLQLAGEAIGDQFERGLSQYPSIDDPVHIVVESDLRRIYGGTSDDQIPIGTLASSENITVRISLDNLVTRHSAIIGSTGSGKSTTVASLLRSIVAPANGGAKRPWSRILLLDLHGEYSNALGDVAHTFSTTPTADQEQLYVPYWAREAEDLFQFTAGALNENQATAFLDKLFYLKKLRINTSPLPGAESNSLTVDSPIPFSLRRLWHEMIDFETMTLSGPARDHPELISNGDEETLTPPEYRPHGMGAAGPYINPAAKGVRRQTQFHAISLIRSQIRLYPPSG